MNDAVRVSLQSIAVNLFLSAGKLLAGILGHSAAMISDAVHSASDVFSTVVVLIGLKLAGQREDKDHEYGHDRLECIAGILLAMVLAVTGIGIGISGVESLRTPKAIAVPGIIALIAAIVSVVAKEVMYHVTMRTAKRTGSSALKADAWHHRSDALSSVGSMAGILGAWLGFPEADPIASLVICAFILKTAADIFLDAAGRLTDKACPENVEGEMRRAVLSCDQVRRVDLLKTRQFGARVYVDVEIAADGNLPLVKAHAIAEQVHIKIENSFPNVKHCMVHVNPA